MRFRTLFAVAFCLSGVASAQWSDNFNRPDGPVGSDWTEVSGSWAIVTNQGTKTSSGVNEILQHNSASLSYDTSTSKLDVFSQDLGSQFSALLIGLGGLDTIMVKIQDQDAVPGFSNIGIYHRVGTSWGAWTGTGTGFATLTAPFASARMTVTFPDPDTLMVELDTDFNGTPEQIYTKTGVLTIAANLGTGFGISGWQATPLFDNFEVSGGPPPVTTYCTAGTSTNGCVPSIAANNNPSVSVANPCDITVTGVEGQKNGLLFYGVNNAGFAFLPWGLGTSFLCVKAPTQRTTAQLSGGTAGLCDGQFALDWNAFIAANPGALGTPFSAGDKVYMQGWFRDPPAPKTTNLTDAVELTYVP